MAKLLRGTAREIGRLGRALRAGEVVGVPTETVYGLAADAFNARACRRIFQVKGRPADDPLIVHVGTVKQAGEVAEIGPGARRLMRAYWPGPLTLVLPKRAAVPAVVTSGRDSVAVRMPAHRLMRRLLAAAGTPLAAPSANRFGYVSPTTAEHVLAGLGDRIRFVLDGGPCAIGVESTIVDLRDEARPRVLRPGKIGRREIERVLGTRVTGAAAAAAAGANAAGGKHSAGMIAPGMLARHYSPRTPVVLHRRVRVAEVKAGAATEAWVFLRVPRGLAGRKNVFSWGPGKSVDLSGVAQGLFATLRRLDGEGWRRIHAEMAPRRAFNKGEAALAEAINDRLRRAAAR